MKTRWAAEPDSRGPDLVKGLGSALASGKLCDCPEPDPLLSQYQGPCCRKYFLIERKYIRETG